jgi:hypothetical protein
MADEPQTTVPLSTDESPAVPADRQVPQVSTSGGHGPRVKCPHCGVQITFTGCMYCSLGDELAVMIPGSRLLNLARRFGLAKPPLRRRERAHVECLRCGWIAYRATCPDCSATFLVDSAVRRRRRK